MRVLLEYGLNKWSDEETVAEHIFEELNQFRFDNPEMENFYDVYKQQYDQGLNPSAKTLLYHEERKNKNACCKCYIVSF